MSRKAHKKFQAACLIQARKGLVNTAEGEWKSGPDSAMARDMRAGYKLAGTAKRRK